MTVQHRTNSHFTLATKSHFNSSGIDRVDTGNSVHYVIAKPEVPSHNLLQYTFRHNLESFGAIVKDEFCSEDTQDFIHWQVNALMDMK